MSYHVKRKDLEITDEKHLKKILKETTYVTLALSMNNQPYLVSLSHGYDEKRNRIYFHCATEGKKLHYFKANPTIWGQAMLDHGYLQGKCTHLYASVHFQGKITIIEDLQEKRAAAECMINQLDKEPAKLLADLADKRLNNAVIGKIDIDYISGKKSKELEL
jgi:uncharacterized protein